LTEMAELAFEIDPDLAADVAPTPAEGEIFREIAARVRVGHAIEKTPMQMRLRMIGWTVGDVIQFRIALHHLGEDMPLDHHEAGRSFRHLDEGVGVNMGAHLASAMTDRIERIVGVAKLEL